ncbi:MAG: hypothetical protein INQ03_22815 [Candidatus Heimdallarchaeota archaeon]|nr:hypothetical protein [Candidatus Heimdallarchaeota archaeon]
MSLLFDEERISEIENTPFTGVMTPEQEKIMNLITGVINMKIPNLKQIVAKGIFRMAIKSWIEETGKDPRLLMAHKVDDVKDDIKSILSLYEKRLEMLLRNKTDSNLLSTTMLEVFNIIVAKRKEMENQ